jgi:hypothetical protein
MADYGPVAGSRNAGRRETRPSPSRCPGSHMRPPSSSCGRGRLLGRNRPAAATRRWRAWERFVAADAVVIKLRAGYPSLHPLMPERPVGVLVSVAHGQFAVTPSTTRAVALRHVRLVRVRRISAGNRSRKNKRRSTTQYRSAMASKPECHSDSLTPSTWQAIGVSSPSMPTRSRRRCPQS